MEMNYNNSRSKRSFYDILEVPKNADADVIKKAYKKQALRYHPDKNDNDPACVEKFKEINRAYNILSNPDKRSIYDKYGEQGVTLVEQMEAQNIDVSKYLNSKLYLGCFIFCFCITGCCFGCCCCCNFCCGLCRPKPTDKYENEMHFSGEGYEDLPEGGVVNASFQETRDKPESTVTQQPKSSFAGLNEMPE